MSVWKRFQRVGKKAAKFQFTASYTELIIETDGFEPSNIVITAVRRSRKYPSEPIKLVKVKSQSSSYSHIWEVPKNEEIITTLYKMKKEVEYEEKDWTFQLEDTGDNGTRRRLLAYRNINMSQYASLIPTQNNIKIIFKISSKKIKSATLFLTLSAVFIKEGEATDDDMISVASLMSMSSSQNFSSIQSSDIARLSDFDDLSSEHSNNMNEKFNELFNKIGNLDIEKWNIDDVDSVDSSKTLVRPHEKSPQNESFLDNSLSKSTTSKIDLEEGRLSNIAEEDYSPAVEPNSTSDLLDWCKFITSGYKNIRITNFTTSFRNGIAFCAIIHHFNPNLIDFDSLTPSNVKENNRIAFTAAASLGIPKVLDPNEMNFLKVPDSLSIMTYLHQLRTHFTDNNLIITPASISNTSPHSYKKQSTSNFSTTPIEPKDFDSFLPKELHDININTLRPSQELSNEKNVELFPLSPSSEISNDTNTLSPSPLSQLSLNNKMNSSTVSTELLDVIKTDSLPRSSTISDDIITSTIKPHTNGISTISKDNTDSIKIDIKTESDVSIKKKSPKKSKLKLSGLNVDGTIKEDSSWSEKKIKRVNLGKLNLFSEHNTNENHPLSPSKPSITSGSPLSPKAVAVDIENKQTDNSYIFAETAALEREQEKIDEEASQLEKQLRLVLNKHDPREPILLDKWFVLVNKKNALIRRNMQLQILDKEHNLENKWNLLQEELRQINSIEDWNKTEDMKRREDLLMKDLVYIINQRDKVVSDLDEYERRMANEIEFVKKSTELYSGSKFSRSLATAKYSDKNCVVQ